jgi:hypothetical protein
LGSFSDSSIRSIINGIVVLFVVIWLLQVFGVIGPIGGLRLGSLRTR